MAIEQGGSPANPDPSTESKQDEIIANQTDGSQITQIKYADSPAIDSFGRLRVSNPETLFDSKQIFDNPDRANDTEQTPLFYDNQETSGTGTSTTFVPAESSTKLGVSANTAGTRIRQTKRRFNYQPGKSMLVFNTFSFNTQISGITQREGQFDDDNGLFLEDNGSTYGFVRRTKTSGSVVDNRVTQANWNLDTMDGNGSSGITLDFTKTQIQVIDFEWLGAGRVRMGFVVNGLIYYAHEFLNTNVLDVVYMQTPNLPLRSEISNDGTAAEDANLVQICSTVIIEGGERNLGIIRYVSTGGTHVDCAVENTIYAIIGIRLKSAYLGESVRIINTAMQLHTASDKVEWILKFNPTVAGTFTYSDVSDSAIQVATGATANTVTGGHDIAGGFVESSGIFAGASGSFSSRIVNPLQLGSLIDGTVDEIVLCARPIDGSSDVDVEGSITFQELS